jgi:phosphonate transport system permease protein
MTSPVPPLAARRPWRPFAALATVALLAVSAFLLAEWDLSAFTDPETRARALSRAGDLVASFADPDLSAEWVATCARLTLETLAVAVLATALAIVLATGLALGASRTVMVGEERYRGRWRNFPLRSPRALFCSLCRLVLDVLRAVPDFAWAVILVAALGLGPATGAVALGLGVAGILGKVWSELWDGVDERRTEAVRSLGGGRLATFLYGIRPLAARAVQSFTLMRAECAIRNAAVIGAVGGGGLGAEILYRIGMGEWAKTTTLILFTLALTLSADLASDFIRRQLRSDANHPRARRARSPAASIGRAWIGAGFAFAIVLWAVAYLGFLNHSGPEGEPRNHLAPLAKLLSGEQLAKLGFFGNLLRPEFDPEAFGGGDPQVAAERRELGTDARPFREVAVAELWRPSAWRTVDSELEHWFVWRVLKSAGVPVALGIAGTILGVLGALLLTFLHSTSFQLESARFTGETPSPLARTARALFLALGRGSGLVLRGVPEVMWAFLFIAFAGPGMLAGALAIALHSAGVLVRVFGETVDNIPHRTLEIASTGSRASTFIAAAAPISWRDWWTYAIFQFESNVRTGVVLGIVGVGGLGFAFTFNFEWFRFEKASTHLLVIILLTVVIDRVSRRLSLSRVRA